MIRETAKAGMGKAYFVSDNQKIQGNLISALRFAILLALNGFQIE